MKEIKVLFSTLLLFSLHHVHVQAVVDNEDGLTSIDGTKSIGHVNGKSSKGVEGGKKQRLRRLFGSAKQRRSTDLLLDLRLRELYYNYNDDGDNKNNKNDDAYANGDDKGDDVDDQYSSFKAENLCTQYLFTFLGGTTDAKDNCEGIQNAYVSAYCGDTEDDGSYRDDDHDDYFVSYNHLSCCQSLKGHYDAYCDESEIITNMHLLLIASILLLCEMAKGLIKAHKLHWMPEAGGCIIVGTLFGFFTHLTPHVDIDDLSFNEDLFLCILLPPIIFEAALSVNKKEFRRRRLAIMMFAVIGTNPEHFHDWVHGALWKYLLLFH